MRMSNLVSEEVLNDDKRKQEAGRTEDTQSKDEE